MIKRGPGFRGDGNNERRPNHRKLRKLRVILKAAKYKRREDIERISLASAKTRPDRYRDRHEPKEKTKGGDFQNLEARSLSLSSLVLEFSARREYRRAGAKDKARESARGY